MGYSKGYHTTFRHRYHIVWAPKYQFKVLPGEVRLRVRGIIKQVCDELGVTSVRACCRATTPICSSKSHRTSRSATSFAGQRAGRRARSSTSANAIGASASGAGDTSQPGPATSSTTSSIDISTAIPTKPASAPPGLIPPGSAGQSATSNRGCFLCLFRHFADQISGLRFIGVKGDIGLRNDAAALALIIHRSEEHTSELQSLMRISYAVFRLKKKKNMRTTTTTYTMYNYN